MFKIHVGCSYFAAAATRKPATITKPNNCKRLSYSLPIAGWLQLV